MRRADRLLQIVQILRRANGQPVSADKIAQELEVTKRTIYRDMVALESINVPVRGEAGIGYILEGGLDLPPLIFNSTELETLMLGARWVQVHGDVDQQLAAKDVIAKIAAVLPEELKAEFLDVPLYAPARTKERFEGHVGSDQLRAALKSEKILNISYRNEAGEESDRRVWPISIGYFDFKRLMLCWCELRQDFRAFRADRISKLEVLDQRLPRSRDALKREWWELEVRKRESLSS
ncbi:helix-turn-helix transcriptional regulator [Maritalea sp.]|jgi:predicted DNA-binding transcriptional regulator YafY|uniref:helix-turn-helix transcriptional regulator n=1 Tax=Maritalea sp. TaxID=2003361 RepID=UPI0039E6EFA9